MQSVFKRNRVGVVVGLLALSAAFAITASAHKGATGVVKERMDLMKSLSDTMKELAAMFRGKSAYSENAVRKAAVEIKGHGEHMRGLFPAGSNQHPSESRPEVWTKPEGFEKLTQDMIKAAIAMEAAAATRAQAQTAFGEIGATCKSCHDDYRIEKKK